MYDPLKSVRITQLPNGRFRLEIITALPLSRGAIINPIDGVLQVNDIPFDELVLRIRETFPEIANP